MPNEFSTTLLARGSIVEDPLLLGHVPVTIRLHVGLDCESIISHQKVRDILSVTWERISLWEPNNVIVLESLSQITCIVNVGIRRRTLAADVYPEELIVRCDDC